MASYKRRTNQTDVESAVSDAFSEMSSIGDELQEWYDSLPESFQNGSKGEALQTAIDAIQSLTEPSVPECIGTVPCAYEEYYGKIGRPKRRDTCINMLDAARSAAQERIDELAALTFDDAGRLVNEAGKVLSAEEAGDDPLTMEDRDSQESELESFISDCDDAIAEWENIEFPGMYG